MTDTGLFIPIHEAHLGVGDGLKALGRCALRTAGLLGRRELHQPAGAVGRRVRWADGTNSAVYRETVADHAANRPCTLVVRFRLRGVRRPIFHALFRLESELNTVLFAGFPGFVSKLWFANDERGLPGSLRVGRPRRGRVLRQGAVVGPDGRERTILHRGRGDAGRSQG
jgi:hypothetical protein